MKRSPDPATRRQSASASGQPAEAKCFPARTATRTAPSAYEMLRPRRTVLQPHARARRAIDLESATKAGRYNLERGTPELQVRGERACEKRDPIEVRVPKPPSPRYRETRADLVAAAAQDSV